jgi:hypothetical protein
VQKRAFERIPVSLEGRFFCGNTIYSGVITDVSENGIFISTRMCFPYNSIFELMIPIGEKVLKVPVRVSRMAKTDEFYSGMGVKILGKVPDYLEFVRELKSNYKP